YYHTYAEVHDQWRWAWWPLRMPYGPANLPLFEVAAWLSNWAVPASWVTAVQQVHPMAGAWLGALNALLPLYFLKAVNLGLHLAGLWLLYGIVPPHPMYRQRLFLYAVNPLLLFELVSNGHQDALVVFFTCASLAALRSGSPLTAFAASLAATLSKLLAISLPVGLLLYFLRRGQYRTLLLSIAMGLATFILVRLCWFDSIADMKVLTPWFSPFGTTAAILYIPGAVENTIAMREIKMLFWYGVWPATAIYCGWVLLQARRWSDFVAGQLVTWAALLVVLSTYTRVWYVTCLLPLGVLLPAGLFEYTLLCTFCCPVRNYYEMYWTAGVVLVLVAALLLCWSSRADAGPRRRLALGLAAFEGVLYLLMSSYWLPNNLTWGIGAHLVPLAWLIGTDRLRRRRPW
ncbi:MAG TPA: hypothetical protein VGO93_17365, partial [Candidatus Xenobia bacterium]